MADEASDADIAIRPSRWPRNGDWLRVTASRPRMKRIGASSLSLFFSQQ
jgi:hypothetical protein